MSYSEQLRIEMAKQRLKIGDVVEKSGVSRETVTFVVNDEAENPKLKTLEQIGKAVGLGLRVEFYPLKETAITEQING